MKKITFETVILFITVMGFSIVFKLIFQDQLTWEQIICFNLVSLVIFLGLFLYKIGKDYKNNTQIQRQEFENVFFGTLKIDEIFWRLDIPLKCKKISKTQGRAIGINSIFDVEEQTIVKTKVKENNG